MVLNLKEWEALRPWFKFWRWAKRRCQDRTHKSHKHYRKHKVKFKLTVDDVRLLWFRDHAWEMVKASLDREDSHGHYEFSNCRFMEFAENSGRARRKLHEKV